MNDNLQKEVEDAKVEGWQVDSEQSDKVVLVKRGWGTLGGHVLIGFLTIWWTLGIGNVLYAAYKYFVDTDKKVIRQDDL
jgi:hypothetical protein